MQLSGISKRLLTSIIFNPPSIRGHMRILQQILSCLPHKKLYIDFSTLLTKSGGNGNIIARKTSFEIAKVQIKLTLLNKVIFFVSLSVVSGPVYTPRYLRASISVHNINKIADKGQPCFTPLRILKCSRIHLSFQNLGDQYILFLYNLKSYFQNQI